MNRLEKLKKLAAPENYYYSRLCKRLSEFEFDQVVEFIEDHEGLDAGEFEKSVNRMHLEGSGYTKTKNYAIIQDILLCCRLP